MQQAQAGQASGVNERERWGGFAGDHGVGRAGITVFPESCRPEELITVLRLERKGLLGAGWTAPFVPGREGDEAALHFPPGQ